MSAHRKIATCGDVTLEALWVGGAWQSPSCGAQYATARQALRRELEICLDADGVEPGDERQEMVERALETMRDTERRYTTWGPVRGMGPVRDSQRAAERDLQRDTDGCAAQGGYSDRQVYAVDPDGYLLDPDSLSGYLMEPDGQRGVRI